MKNVYDALRADVQMFEYVAANANGDNGNTWQSGDVEANLKDYENFWGDETTTSSGQ